MNEVEQAWAEYKEKLDQMANQLKLVAYWTKETADACNEVAEQTELVAKEIRAYIEKPKL